MFSDYQLHELIWSEMDYNSVYFDDKFLVTGHRPVQLITNGQRDIILKMNNHIAIDCGCALGAEGRLAVLCLDTMEELHF